MSENHDDGRRRFLGYAALVALAPLAANQAVAQTKALPKLPLDNAQAKSLGYVEKAATSKHATFKPGRECSNCMLYKGPAGQAYGPCQLFPKNSVAAKGWCSAWVKKA